jgi:hypothetical protein
MGLFGIPFFHHGNGKEKILDPTTNNPQTTRLKTIFPIRIIHPPLLKNVLDAIHNELVKSVG